MTPLLMAAALVNAAPLPALAGNWQSVGQQHLINVEYRAISNGLATVERWRTASGRETMTVFVADRDRTIATHYCAQGNVATLRSVLTADNRITTFDFVSVQGVDPGESVLVKLVLERSDHGLRRTETYRLDGRDSTVVIDFVGCPERASSRR